MSFRKRNIGLSSSSRTPQSIPTSKALPPGVRPSPIDGRPTTSTGTPSLDALLAGHGGLALGTSLLIEESSTTDFGGALLRYYAAEGVVQGHHVHVVGVDEGWSRELPGLIGPAEGGELDGAAKGKGSERMKIAWRYERLGEFRGVAGSRAPPSIPNRAPLAEPLPPIMSPAGASSPTQTAFCHTFDLTKRLALPSPSPLSFLPASHFNHLPQASPFATILQALTTRLRESPPSTVHRIIIPTLLSPALYPGHACLPQHLLRFLHALRGLLRRYPSQLTAMITLPLELYPRDTGLVRWIEILSDGVLELTPFPHLADNSSSITTSGAATAQEDKPQGMVKIHSLPIFHERGGGGGALSGLGEDLAFTVSRRKFAIKAFSLPPVEGDTEAQQGKFGGDEDGRQTTYVLELVVDYLSERKLNHPITKHLIVNLTPAPVQRRQISMADDDEGLEALAELEKEASEFNKVEKISATYTTEIFLLTRDISSQDAEIDRILKAFRLDAYAVLGLQPGVSETDIKNTYRKKSLLIHPDKTKNPYAPDAFDRLKKAQTELMDEKLRTHLDEAIADARMLLIRERKWTIDHPDLTSEAFARDWREKTKFVLIENEHRRRKQIKGQMAEEGRQKKKEDEELELRKRKRDYEQEWEQTRENRINSWRDFSKKGGEKKKKKVKVLG